MEALAIGVLLLLVFVLVSSLRPAKPQVVYIVERSSSSRHSGCLLLLVLAIVTFLAVSR